MGNYTLDKTTTAGNRGSHYNESADFIYYVNQTEAKIYRQPVNPATVIVQQAPITISANSSHNLNKTGAFDLKWTGSGATGALQTLNGAKILKLTGQTSLEQITPANMTGLTWGSALTQYSENGQSTTGVCYAIQVPAGSDSHYAKVRIFKDGSNTKLEWTCYITSTNPLLLHQLDGSLFPEPHDIVVSADDLQIFISGGSTEGYIIYLTRIAGGAFPFYGSPTVVNAEPLLNPQQMVIDGAAIYVAAGDGLFAVDTVTNYQSQVVSGITNPVGLLIKQQNNVKTAYITDASGNVYVVDISSFNLPSFNDDGSVNGQTSDIINAPSPSTTLALGGPSGYLTWSDGNHTSFYVALPTLNAVKRVDLLTNTISTEEVGTPSPTGPWSVDVFDENDLSVVCNAEIGDIKRGITVDGSAPWALGIGLIPFSLINNSDNNPAAPAPNDGKADTSSVPGYYFSNYPNLPFGGSLSLLINHSAAYAAGARYYKISIANVQRDQSDPNIWITQPARNITNAFTDLRWNGSLNPPRFEGISTGTQDGYYPIRQPGDLWYNMFLGAIMGTSISDNGYNRLKIDFYTAGKVLIPNGSFTKLIYIDNNLASGQVFDMRRGSSTVAPNSDDYQSISACGTLEYDSKDDLIEFDFMASRIDGLGSYTLSFSRGGVLFSATGNVTTTPTLMTVKERLPGTPLRIGHLVGNCNVANIGVSLHVPSRVTNGYGWVNWVGFPSKNFTLAMGPLTHTPWSPPA